MNNNCNVEIQSSSSAGDDESDMANSTHLAHDENHNNSATRNCCDSSNQQCHERDIQRNLARLRQATFVATGVAEKFIAVGCAVFEAESYILQLLLQTQDRSANIEKISFETFESIPIFVWSCHRQ